MSIALARASPPPKPKPVWTAWIETVDGIEMARVRLDAGQFSFRAGREIRNDNFPECAATLIEAILHHAREKGWIE